MKKVVDIALELIENSEDKETTTEEILKNIKGETLLNLEENKIKATIISDLMIDGRFLCVEGAWHLKNDFTIDEIIKEQYRSLNDYEILLEDELDITSEESEQELQAVSSLDDKDQMEADDAISITGKDLND